jgi:hypothetical protein
MSLVEVTRFEDPYEGEIAASALRASGIEARIIHSGWGVANPMMRRATGGVPLLADPVHLDDVWTLLNDVRGVGSSGEAQAADWKRHPQAVSSIMRTGIILAAAACLGPVAGWALYSYWNRKSRFGIGIIVACIGLVAVVIGAAALR